jgi:anti-anti-sigma factor
MSMDLDYFNDFNQMDYDTKIKCNFMDEEETQIIISINGDMETFYTKLFIKSVYSLFENEKKIKMVLLNFIKVRYMSSSGIASLLQIINRAKSQGIEILFINLNSHMQRIIDALGLGHFIQDH